MDGWIDWKKRNNVSCRKTVEATSICATNVENWKSQVWTGLIKYEEKNIFSADEAGLFYKMVPDQTLKERSALTESSPN